MKKRIFGFVLIFIGITFIGSALFMRYSAERKQKQMIQAFQKTLQDSEENSRVDASQSTNGQDSGNDSTKGSSDTAQNTSSPDTKPNSQDIKAMALMIIPRINLQVAVTEGTNLDDLKYAVGHFEGTAMPGEKGNFCVAGHRSYTYNEYFNRLDELKNGDEIIVRTKKGEFTYVVNEEKVVEPTEVSVLNPTKDATITLVTCTPIRVATHRLIIKGKLK